jgi:formylglycine-generating enzyme required for sulfatase activity
VTVAQFRQFVDATGYKTTAEANSKGGYALDMDGEWIQANSNNWREFFPSQQEDHPIVHVSWDDAVAFCDWLSELEGRVYRLPTEAEWEYAARAGNCNRWAFLNHQAELEQYAWFDEDNSQPRHRVAMKQPNGLGLHDMLGGVWEWCQDFYQRDYYSIAPDSDPPGPESGSAQVIRAGSRVIRGGSYRSTPYFCRAGCRFYFKPPQWNSPYLGFRVVAEL